MDNNFDYSIPNSFDYPTSSNDEGQNIYTGLLNSFGIGMARKWNKASATHKANFPNWWKDMMGYDESAPAKVDTDSANSYHVPNKIMDGEYKPYKLPNQFMDAPYSGYTLPENKPYEVPNKFIDKN